tara:strand:- start:2032 stop:2169 length:138 start_codon:yes stop_codon:yes gene_type:complete
MGKRLAFITWCILEEDELEEVDMAAKKAERRNNSEDYECYLRGDD